MRLNWHIVSLNPCKTGTGWRCQKRKTGVPVEPMTAPDTVSGAVGSFTV